MKISRSFDRQEKVADALRYDATIDSLQRQLIHLLHPQFLHAGLRPNHIPSTGATALGAPRGYLMGMVEGVLARNLVDPSEKERGPILVALVFEDTYGAAGWAMALDTLDELQAGKADVVRGHERAREDLDAFFAEEPQVIIRGFVQLSGLMGQADP